MDCWILNLFHYIIHYEIFLVSGADNNSVTMDKAIGHLYNTTYY